MADDDIAIVGVGCRFPGADNLQEFWQVLVNGENHVKDIPAERWNNEPRYSEDKDAVGKTYVKKAGLLKDHDQWDNKFFGVSDTEASRMDPQQRNVLECTHMALEDGGITRSRIDGSLTGVYIGVMNDDFKGLVTQDTTGEGINTYSATGMSTTIIASRVSYMYNLRGPCLVIDTACSSSLIAVHLGCQAIRTGDCTRAICGGVSSILSPETFVTLCKARMMSATGQCQTFCDTADGYARAEGCGIVVLMKLKQALEEDAKIWGVIKTGSNQDGAASHPITAPSGDQQMALLRHVYSIYDINPSTVQYIEAHGTGTAVGDPTEVNTLGRFFSESGRSEKHLLIGSVKSNIGHTESAAGAAGLIKVLLMMKHGTIVPSLHVKKDKSNVNKMIQLKEYNLDIPVDLHDWSTNSRGERVACVNSFGFGGSNCHAVVFQYPHNRKRRAHGTETKKMLDFPAFVSVSAPDENSLLSNLDGIVADLAKLKTDLWETAFTSFFHRDIMKHRTLVYGKNVTEIKQQVELRKKTLERKGGPYRNNLIFVYCGVGTTWNGMCKEMMQIPRFREKINEIDMFLGPLAGWKVADLFSSESSVYDDPLVNHICIFATQVALTAVWTGWNVTPDAIVGQSVGEVAAAYVSGIIPLEEAVRIIYHRSRILAKHTGGGMMVVGNMPLADIEVLCSKYNTVDIAVYSSPVACTLSGDVKELQLMKKELEHENEHNGKSYLVRELKVQCAYHSRFVEDSKPDIEHSIGSVKNVQGFKYPIISSVSAQKATTSDFTSGKYWAENVRQPVKFFQSLQAAMIENTRTVFLEIGPRQVLRAHVENVLDGRNGTCLPSMNAKKELTCMYDSLADLYQIGYNISLDDFKIHPCLPVETPRYRFTKTKNLFVPPRTLQYLAGASALEDTSHQYIKRIASNTDECFEVCIDKEVTRFVFDHFLSQTVLVPGATYIDIGFHVASVCLNKQMSDLSLSVEFELPLTPSLEGKTLSSVTVEKCHDGTIHFKCHGKQNVYAMGSVCLRTERHYMQVDVEEIRIRCGIERNKKDCYRCLSKFDFEYGPLLSLMEKSLSNEEECLVWVSVPDTIISEFTKTKAHPAVVDSMIQTFAIVQDSCSKKINAIPKGARQVHIHAPFEDKMIIYTREVFSTDEEKHYKSFLMSVSGFVLAEIHDMYMKIISNALYKEPVEYYMKPESYSQLDSFGHFSGPVLVYDISENESTYFRELLEGNDVFTKVPKLDLIESGKTQAVIFYCGNIRTDNELLEFCVLRFQKLKECMIRLSDMAVFCPWFVVTENTQTFPDRTSEINVRGAEFWGVARTVRAEGLNADVRLVDIDTENLNPETLVKVFTSKGPPHAELCLNGSNVFHFRVSEVQDFKRFRNIAMDKEDSAMLFSKSKSLCLSPWFKPNKRKLNRSFTTIRLSSVVLHDNSLHTPNTNKDLIQPWREKNCDGFPVIAFEGTGQTEAGESVVFVFPVKVTMPFVEVPKDCVIPEKEICFYDRGLFILLAVLYNVASTLPDRSVIVIKEDKMNVTPLLLRDVLKHLRKEICISPLQKISECTLADDISTVVVLCDIRSETVEDIVANFRSLRSIVTLNKFFPEDLRIEVQVKYSTINIVAVDLWEILKPNTLMTTIPELRQIMASISKHSPGSQSQELLWNYPMEYLSLDGNRMAESVLMKVDNAGLFRSHGCYIVVGGLTGLGWVLLQHMAETGAGHLAIFSRRSPSNDQKNELNNIEVKFGCKIYHIQVDITDIKSLKTGFCTLKDLSGNVPIKGIFQGAGVLSDAVFQNQTEESVRRVFSPKILGSWNLHISSLDLPLDFFVMHSSVVSLIGNRGQSNYAAANSFMDSLAAFRRSKGLCGQALNWGPLDVGMVANDKNLKQQLEAIGYRILSEKEVKRCFVNALLGDSVQVVLAKLQWDVVNYDGLQNEKYKRLMKGRRTDGNSPVTTDLHCDIDWASVDETSKENMLRSCIRKTVCQEYLVSDDNLSDDTTFTSIGVDSMKALSFANSFHASYKIRIPMVKMLSENATVNSLVQYCLENLPVIKETSDVHDITSADILDDKIPFTQKATLKKYIQDKANWQLCDVFELEFRDVNFDFQQWRLVIKQTLMIHPELRKRYFFSGQQITSVIDPEIADDVPELTEIPFSAQNTDVDIRQLLSLTFDTEKEHPVKFHIAIGKQKTLVRIILQKVCSDMQSLVLVCRTIKMVGLSIKNGNALPENNSIDAQAVIKMELSPKWTQAEEFWKARTAIDIKPVTLGHTLAKANERDYKINNKTFTQEFYRNIKIYLQKNGLTLFHLSVSLFQLLLYLETSQPCFAVSTASDIRGHVPELNSVIMRCVNRIPLIVSFEKTDTLKQFFNKNSEVLKDTMDYSFYPQELILEKIRSKETRENIVRHYIVMHNVGSTNRLLTEQEGMILKGRSRGEHDYETQFFTEYDSERHQLSYELGFNSRICGHETGRKLLNKFIWLLENLEMIESVEISGLNDVFQKCTQIHAPKSLPVFVKRLPLSTERQTTNLEMKIPKTSLKSELDRVHPTVEKMSLLKGEITIPGNFKKFTRHGWSHDVTLALECTEDGSQMFMTWGSRCINLLSIKNIWLRKQHGRYSLELASGQRSLLFTTSNYQQADTWIRTIRDFTERKPKSDLHKDLDTRM